MTPLEVRRRIEQSLLAHPSPEGAAILSRLSRRTCQAPGCGEKLPRGSERCTRCGLASKDDRSPARRSRSTRSERRAEKNDCERHEETAAPVASSALAESLHAVTPETLRGVKVPSLVLARDAAKNPAGSEI